MEDAPPESNAHLAVALYRNSRYKFKLRTPEREVVEFEVLIKQAGGNREDAARIARLCYDRLEAGIPVPEVEAYRDQLCSTCQPPPPASKRQKVQHVQDEGSLEADRTASSSSTAPASASVAQNPAAVALEMRLRKGLEGVSDDNLRRKKMEEVRKRNNEGKLQQLGLTAEDVEEVIAKLEMDLGLRAMPTPTREMKGKGRAKSKAKGKATQVGGAAATAFIDEVGAIAILRAEGGVEDALYVTGRTTTKTHFSVNGIYRRRPVNASGMKSYERLNGPAHEKRLIWYKATSDRIGLLKEAWVISDRVINPRMLGQASIFAYLETDWRGTNIDIPSLSAANAWRICDSHDASASEDSADFSADPAVKCNSLQGSDLFWKLLESAVKRKEQESNSKEEADRQAEEQRRRKEEEQLQKKSVVAEKRKVKAEAAAKRLPRVKPQKFSLVAQTKDEDDLFAKKPEASKAAGVVGLSGRKATIAVPTKGRVAAKMMVRAGVRCACHFEPVGQCQSKVVSDEVM